MIVEDDPMVMDIHRRFAQSFSGFSVEVTAKSGKEALEALNKIDVDLVILDIYMPELDGLETLRRIRQDRRAIDSSIMRRETQATRDGCLPKGLSARQLEKVLACLREAGNGLAADDVARITGVSRVTARRYLEYLVSISQASVDQEHRSVGRPINLYRII